MSSRPSVLIVNNFHAETVAQLDELYDTHKLWLADSAQELEALLQRLSPHCTAAATASWTCDRRTYDLPQLQHIACFGVGTDGVDLQLAAARDITVSATPGVLNDAVADLAIALILMTHRNLVSADRYVREGRWPEAPFPFSRSVTGRKLGIVGMGAIGAEIARRALPFGMQIAYHSRTPKPLPFPYFESIEALARDSDILLSMLPGGEQTRHILGAAAFEQLGPDGIFINLGRGSAVDEAALVAALQAGRIAGAGLDVFENEPHVPPALLSMDQVVLLPHVGSATVETRRAMGQMVVDSLARHFAGQ